jgi:anti-anti-sigma regulatory factor
VHGRIDLPNVIYLAGMFMSDRMLRERLAEVRPRPERLADMGEAIEKMIFLDTYLVLDQIHQTQRQAAERAAEENALLEARSEALLEQATPVTPIWEGILLLPLIGVLDSSRTQEIMTKTLSMISESRTKVFMLDISGVRSVDTAVANQLVKITQATRLMGCEAIVSGISPEIAFTMVELGVGIGQIRTTATLRDAFEIALTIVGDAERLRKAAADRGPLSRDDADRHLGGDPARGDADRGGADRHAPPRTRRRDAPRAAHERPRGVRRNAPRAVVFEASGLDLIDAAEFAGLAASPAGAVWLGVRAMLVGLSAGIVAYLVDAAVDTSAFEPFGTLDDALAVAVAAAEPRGPRRRRVGTRRAAGVG